MSHWTCVVFEAEGRDPEALEADLRDAIAAAGSDACRESEAEDPNTWVEDGRVYWYCHGFGYGTTFDALDVECDRALAMDVNDTTMAATGYLYERVDGDFVATDSYFDEDYGRTALDYFAIEHDIRGDRSV